MYAIRSYYDKAALDNFKSIPFFTTLLKSFMSFFSEQMLHGVSMAQKIRLSEKQLPEIYRLLPPIVSALGIKEPEFYLEMSPIPNAYTQGYTTTFLVITSYSIHYTKLYECALKGCPSRHTHTVSSCPCVITSYSIHYTKLYDLQAYTFLCLQEGYKRLLRLLF